MRRHVRGSTLLLAGRFLSLAVSFAVQVATVRYLSKTDYGSFAFALAMVEIASMLTALGLDKAVSRFAPIYHERHDYSRLFGAITLVLGAMCGLALALITLVYGCRGLIAQSLELTPAGMLVLLTLILMTPVGALDALLFSVFTTFASARRIFVRRYVIGPSLKLGAALAVIFCQGDVLLLARFQVAAGVLAVLLYGLMLIQVLRDQGLLSQWRRNEMAWPAREIFSFGLPLLGADVAIAARACLIVIFLQVLHSTASVAEFRAVLPIARLNGIVLLSFSLMFTPIAARLYAQRDHQSLHDLYWRSAAWIAVLTFPLFAVSVCLPDTVTELFFGQRYGSAGMILAVLAVGYYAQAAFGFNARTLHILGKLKHVVAIDVGLTFLAVGLFLWLIPRFGALGGAVGLSAIMILRGILNQLALVCVSDVRIFEPRYAVVFGSVLASSVALVVIHSSVSPPAIVSGCLAAMFSTAVLALSIGQLEFSATFPELCRLPVMRRLLKPHA